MHKTIKLVNNKWHLAANKWLCRSLVLQLIDKNCVNSLKLTGERKKKYHDHSMRLKRVGIGFFGTSAIASLLCCSCARTITHSQINQNIQHSPLQFTRRNEAFSYLHRSRLEDLLEPIKIQ